MQDMHPYYEKIESALTSSGFHKEEISSSNFKAAFTRRGFLTSLVFLIKEVNDKGFNASSMKNLVESGRQWCASNLKATWFVKESGLNLVLLHDGQIGSNDIKGQVDSTGFHGAICQSITTLDVTNGSVAQEKTWVVIGKVRKALRKLNEIA
ncbi:MAG: hypothetical protein ACE5K8_06990 [Candidatus Zixiibacteriota bacterium]